MPLGSCTTKTQPGSWFRFDELVEFADCAALLLTLPPKFAGKINWGWDFNGVIEVTMDIFTSAMQGVADMTAITVRTGDTLRWDGSHLKRYDTWDDFLAENDVT